MFTNNEHKNSCDFSDQIVAFIYDEIGDNERDVFEKHIKTCASCAKDVASFSDAHLLVRAWRDEEFAPLPSNEIALPNVNAVSGSAKSSWLERLVSFVAVSPARLAFASAVVLALAGIFFFALNRNDQRQIAENVGKPSMKANESGPSKTSAEIPQSVSTASSSVETVPNAVRASTRETKYPNSQTSDSSTRTRIGRSSAIPKSHNFATTNVRKSANLTKRNETEIPQIQLETEADSDDGVRLRDILDEVSMR